MGPRPLLLSITLLPFLGYATCLGRAASSGAVGRKEWQEANYLLGALRLITLTRQIPECA